MSKCMMHLTTTERLMLSILTTSLNLTSQQLQAATGNVTLLHHRRILRTMVLAGGITEADNETFTAGPRAQALLATGAKR